MSYCLNLSTVTEIKAAYRKHCMVHHPDRGGNTATMQEINTQYHAALSGCDGQTVTGSDSKPHTYHYHRNVEQAVMDKIAEIMAVGMVDVEILLIGSWIWITGNTRRYKDQLGNNGLKLRWHSKRVAWYWHLPSKQKYRYNPDVDLHGLAATHGHQGFESEERTAIA